MRMNLVLSRRRARRPESAAQSSSEEDERENDAGAQGDVKAADIEVRAELLGGPRAELAHLQLAELVAARLRRPGDVSISLGLDGWFVDGVRFAHELDHLIAAPSHAVDPGVDHQTDGAEELRAQTTVVRAGILIEAD